MSTSRLLIIFGVLSVVAFGTAGSLVFAGKRRSAENQQAQSAAEVLAKAEAAAKASQADGSASDLKDPFNQLLDPVASVKTSLNNSVYAEGRLSTSTIGTVDLPNQAEMDRIAGLAIVK